MTGSVVDVSSTASTTPDDNAVIAAYQGGEKTADILRRFNISRSSLYWILQRNDIEPSRHRRPPAPPPEDVAYQLNGEQVEWFQDEVKEIHDILVSTTADRAQLVALARSIDKRIDTLLTLVSTVVSVLNRQQDQLDDIQQSRG